MEIDIKDVKEVKIDEVYSVPGSDNVIRTILIKTVNIDIEINLYAQDEESVKVQI